MKYITLKTDDGPVFVMLNWVAFIEPTSKGVTTRCRVSCGNGQSHIHQGPANELIDAITQTINGNKP